MLSHLLNYIIMEYLLKTQPLKINERERWRIRHLYHQETVCCFFSLKMKKIMNFNYHAVSSN